MANEIRITLQLNVDNGAFHEQFTMNTNFDQAALGAACGIALVSQTAASTISQGDVTTLGWAILKNLDATNFVTYGPDSTGMVALGKLKAGEAALIRLKPGITLKALADTADVKVQYMIFQD